MTLAWSTATAAPGATRAGQLALEGTEVGDASSPATKSSLVEEVDDAWEVAEE